ncbi:MAG: ADP-ribose pyrophosphatase [Candidatus Omnitrophota bacterium]|jgi:ADP-ribose pyrophosphatase
MGREIKYEGKYIRFIDEDGWEYVERVKCSGIVIIVSKTKDDEVLFVEQHRVPIQNRTIEFPAGLIDDGAGETDETALQAAHRELLEETGYQAGALTPLIQGPVSGGMSSNSVYMVLAENLTKVHEGGGVEDENITVHHVPIGEVDVWLRVKEKEGFFIEPKIYSGLYFLKGCHK